MATAADLTRQRIDYVTAPDGRVRAILTVTLPGGLVKTFEASINPNDPIEVAGIEVGLFGIKAPKFLRKAIKTVGHVAKAIAHSKVLMLAAGALASAIPFAGPIVGPALMLAATTMGVAGKLSKAHLFAHHGAHAEAKALTSSAVSDAHKLTSTPAAAKGLLQLANHKRLALAKHAGIPASPTVRPAPTARPAPRVAPALAPSDPLAAARAGRVRSNRGGAVSPAELAAAHASGRIFWVS